MPGEQSAHFSSSDDEVVVLAVVGAFAAVAYRAPCSSGRVYLYPLPARRSRHVSGREASWLLRYYTYIAAGACRATRSRRS